MKLTRNILNLIAFTHLFSRYKQTLVGALGVTFGIAMFIFSMNFVKGLNDALSALMLENSPHVRIYNESTAERPMLVEKAYPNAMTVVHHPRPLDKPARVDDGLRIANLLENHPAVKGVSPLVSTQAFFTLGPIQITGLIKGVDIRREDQLFGIEEDLNAGSISKLEAQNNGLIIGYRLANKMSIGMGDNITVVSPKGTTKRLKIVGLLQTGLVQIDETQAYASINTVQTLLGENSRYITDVNFKLHDENAAPRLAASWQRQFGFPAESWQEANSAAIAGDEIRTYMFAGIVMAILLVAGFGIYNIMSMIIREKMKEIAILKAIGFSGADVQGIFLREAIIIGLGGGMVGVGAGYLICKLVGSLPFEGGDVLEMDTLPMAYEWDYYLYALLFGVLTTMIASYFPSRKAAKVDPINIIRG